MILQAPPGAGKSTVLPLQLMDEPWLGGKKIIMLEPRRLAAKSVAERMADLLEEDAGQRIGYSVRFDSKVSSKTKIEVVTEGILTRMIQSDNTLEDVGMLIFDEFHERSLHADLALALSLQMQQVLRDDLRILIMSATLDSENLSSILGGAPIITSSGRQYPVTIHYTPDEDGPVVPRAVHAIRKAVRDEQGDLLVFLPGAGEIKRVEDILREEYFADVSIHPLFGDLPFKQQQQAILPRQDGGRKIVLSTSIAETSLTIEGVRVVIDAGLARVPRFDPRSGLTRLETIRVTRDAADQRAGRSGRLGPGVCYRLWSASTQTALAAQRKPEILEADLAPLMLELYAWGVKEPKELTWITLPTAGAVAQAKELLLQLDAITIQGITPRGKQMLSLPTHPRIAHLLLEANASEKSLAADIAALIEEKDPLAKESGADLALRLEALRKWRGGQKFYADKIILERIEKIAQHWRRLLKTEVSNNMVADTDIGKLLVAAYPERIARQQEKHSERFKLANGRVVKLPPHDPLMREPWLCVAQLDAGSGEGKIFLAAAVSEKDLNALAHETNLVQWDDERGLLTSAVVKRVGNLLLSQKSPGNITEDERVQVLCEAIQKHGLKLLGWNESHEELQARMLSIKVWRPDEAWPDVTDDNLLATLESWLAPFLTTVSRRSELEKLDLATILKSMIPWDLQNKFDALVPSRIEVPSGSMIRLQYFADGRSPIIEVRLQEMFGLTETPSINEGRNKVLIHLLSPGYKPVQVTQDLKSFWQTTYHEVRKELRMRYPRHHWPEDPWTAEAVRGAKRRSS
ncbi:ATP-dependent helicase HrpB [Pseudochryseolinea flava]|uniref:ATP-dependent helicase HrpB n=1 Tax=Pseudochryseolinea flava TaxID=2059302 RepID=UPI001FE427A3|nr:ATP-dependent helicase HrpB [Pseudochryseolinea flava]